MAVSHEELEHVADFIMDSFIRDHDQLKASNHDKHFNLDKVRKLSIILYMSYVNYSKHLKSHQGPEDEQVASGCLLKATTIQH